MKILVIEDEAFFAENLCNYIYRQNENVQIKNATSAKEALECLIQNSFDLVIADIRLPDTQGDEWLLKIGEISIGQKVIIISSYELSDKVLHSGNINIIKYFEKPFDLEEINILINRLIN